MLCRCVCVKESMYERESGERKDVRKSVGGALLPFLGFFGSFCPKSFFFNQLFLLPARRLCLFRVVRCFRESLHVASKRNLGDQQFLIRIEKSASNAEKQTQRTRAFKQREQHIKG